MNERMKTAHEANLESILDLSRRGYNFTMDDGVNASIQMAVYHELEQIRAKNDREFYANNWREERL